MNDDMIKALETARIAGKLDVKTVFQVRVVDVSANGQFVNVIHRNLEWEGDESSDTIMLNSYGEEVRATPLKPWILYEIPVGKFQFGQFKIKARPAIGDDGEIHVCYHDIGSLKREGGFQAPDVISVHDIHSCTYWATGPISYPESDPSFPDSNTMVITSNNASIVINDSGSIPTITINASNANINANVANINAPVTNISGDLNVSGNIDAPTASIPSIVGSTTTATAANALAIAGTPIPPATAEALADYTSHTHTAPSGGGTTSPPN
jgi:hypothetical protein